MATATRNKSLAALMLLLALFTIFDLSTALPGLSTHDVDLSKPIEDAIHGFKAISNAAISDAGKNLVHFGLTHQPAVSKVDVSVSASADTKRALEEIHHNARAMDHGTVDHSAADDTTLECDSAIAPLSKSDVRFAFVEKFCQSIDDEQLRQSSVDTNPVELSVRMYLYVGTQTSNWIYALDEDLCTNSFMHIIDKCTEITALGQ